MHLQDWETFLRPFLDQVELLGEIPLEQPQHAELERALGAFVRWNDLTEATRRLRQDYPATFVTYLAFKAAFNDERGFWEKVANVIGLESAGPLFHPTHHWGQSFLEIIEQYPNLRRFAGISGLEYVTPIRLHGGIPAFSLSDFFRYILLPSVEKAPYDGMDDESALKALLAHYAAELFVDDVVRYFFQHGGQPAQLFFSKCRRMARLEQTGQPLPDASELGLRPYILQSFETFREQIAEPAARRRRPRLFFDPYTPAFRILLPPQPLRLEQAGSRYDGRLYDSQTGEIYAEKSPLRARHRGADWTIDEIEWMLEEPLASVQVGLFPEGQAEALISYSLRLLPQPGYPPLLAFGYADGTLRRLSPTLPAQTLWLFFPARAELRFEGAAHQVESLHPFSPPWKDWQASAWDLEKVRLVRLLQDGKDLCPPIAVSASLEAALTASGLPPQITPVEEKPLYSVPPQLRLPLRDALNPLPEQQGWKLTLESRYAARPAGTWEDTAASLPHEILTGESCALVSLVPWLGNAPLGTYHLTCSHRGRAAVELPFRVCAGLTIEGLQPYYLPDQKDGAPTVRFQVYLPQSARLYAETPEIEIREDGQVTVPPAATQADLRLEIPNQPETIHIPLRVIVPRLRWALLLQHGAAFEWQHQPLTRPLPELLQADLVRSRPRLRVELTCLGGEKPLVELHLFTLEQETPLQTSESHSLTARWAEFDLSAFFDTLRAHPDESVFEFQLELLDTSRNLDVLLPVLRFSRELEIRVCNFESRSDGGWRLHWYEPRPLRHRRLRLWSLWQPWSAPLEIPLPDNAPASDSAPDGWWMYEIPDDYGLPPSEYRVHFVVVSPYEINPLPPFPPEQAIEVQMVMPQSRLWQIKNELANATPARAFALHFEELCIYHSQNRTEQQQQEIRWCLSHWREANLLHLEALTRWLGRYDSSEDQRAFLMHLFREETLKRLEEEHHPADFIQKYLENIASARTINPESARRVLRLAREPQVIVHALQSLFKTESEEARQAFWEALEQGRFSETDAAQILAKYSEFTRQLLKGVPPSPLRRRLLCALSRHMDLPEWVVKIGYFVLFDGGWGRILEIRKASRVDTFLPEEEKPTLLVELLHWKDQKVEINLASSEMNLLERKGAYRCDCQRFVALGETDFRDWNKHWAICEKSNNFPIPATRPLSQALIYQAAPPLNIFNTRPL
jgi:hypothetical protein